MSHMDVASFPKVVSRLYTPLILQYLLIEVMKKV